jgi:class 3 adenylate cyclase
VTCLNYGNASLLNVDVSWPPHSFEKQHSRLIAALIYRFTGFGITGLLVCAWRFAPRKFALAVFVLCFWSLCLVQDLALATETMVDDIDNGFLLPQARQQLPSILYVMLVYTAGIPGIPFTTASIAGWGVMVTTIVQHVISWSGTEQYDDPYNSDYVLRLQYDPWNLLLAQLMRIFLFNVFGTFVGIEQTRQMRLNFWHVRLLEEAVQLHKLCRQRFHRLTANTLPAPIVKAIATGDTAFVKVYDGCTVLQADMVGFTPLSARFPPEKVLGILSDIFEEFDSLCELNSVDKVKTIGDAYIVCAGALSEIRADDAQRVVRMGLAMQEVVTRIALAEGIDVAVRIGVHTGLCTGGIIGTVRFHFDMWGGAVVGAVKMEETGEKGRVHISDSTLPLVADHFEMTKHLTAADLGDTGRELDIHSTFLVGAEKPPPPVPLDAADVSEHEGRSQMQDRRMSRRSMIGVTSVRATARAACWVAPFRLGQVGRKISEEQPAANPAEKTSGRFGSSGRNDSAEGAARGGSGRVVEGCSPPSRDVQTRDRATSNFFCRRA